MGPCKVNGTGNTAQTSSVDSTGIPVRILLPRWGVGASAAAEMLVGLVIFLDMVSRRAAFMFSARLEPQRFIQKRTSVCRNRIQKFPAVDEVETRNPPVHHVLQKLTVRRPIMPTSSSIKKRSRSLLTPASSKAGITDSNSLSKERLDDAALSANQSGTLGMSFHRRKNPRLEEEVNTMRFNYSICR